MAVTKPVPVPKKNISSLDVTGFSGGLYLQGEQNAKGNAIVASTNVRLTTDGFLTPRQSLQKWLPDTIGTVYEIFPAIWEGVIYNFTADNGKIRWCVEGDPDWTDCGGDNDFLMPEGARIKFLRVLDVLLILGGDGGNKLAYVDLATRAVVKYTYVADPLAAPTATTTGSGLSGSTYKIYYGYTFTSASGETKLSPILTQDIGKIRDMWNPDGSEYITITRPSGNPEGAKYWNLYIALASNGGTIQDTDMLMLAGGLDLATTSIVDNGTLAIDIGRGNPPAENSTDGARVRQGIETNGRPVLFDDIDDRHSVHIGGDGEYALDFSSSNGGFRSQPSKGTNYYPASVIGFRNGQGIPALTILFTNTQGLSKQATLEQQTINYGNQTFVVWGVTEQNYSAAGVASGYGVVNYKGQLSFPSTDGFMSMDTQPQLQNVLSTKGIDTDIKSYTNRIKVSALDRIVGTAWNDRVMWIVPAAGFDYPTEILVRDLNNNGAWYTLKIPAQWIGTVSPPSTPAFVYITQDNHIFRLFNSFGTVDYKTGAAQTFATYAKGALIGFNDARNSYQAIVQAMFYLVDMIGNIEIGVNYRDINGEMVTVSEIFEAPQYALSSSGGWSDPQNLYETGDAVPAGWDASFAIDEVASTLNRLTERVPLSINDLASEVQWWVKTEPGYNDWMLRAVSYEGENLGVKPDLR